MLFFKNFLLKRINFKKSLDSWVDETQDFILSNLLIECKTNLEKNNPKIHINSEYQLNITSNEKELFLYLAKILESPEDIKQSFSLNSLYEEIMNQLGENSPELAIFFAGKLFSRGFEKDKKYHNFYELEYEKIYHINSEFPKLIRSDLPDSISEVRYKLSINQLSLFVINQQEFIKKLQEEEI